jgi:hemerythrin-like domain-containing protein
VDLAFDAKIKVLQHCVLRHFEEEQQTLFPMARASLRLDLSDLGAQLVARQESLRAQARAEAEAAAVQRQHEADVARLARNAQKRQKYQTKVLRSR